ncbi:KAP family P-loop NTPase fold protein [Kineococcus sp. SYSU DK005]|uniref:KAP family P-loop NTPase fold protein n=1 Tax=Kineococcus sp. SYSU DK005 TaxID=3383126 RepID=UPI003D7F0BCB
MATTGAPDEPGEPRLLADDPVDASDSHPDLLDRQSMAEHIGRLLDRLRAQSESSVLGLVGPWGSGKSSVLRMLERHLAAQGSRDWIVAWFTPWAYSDAESLQLGFFTELREALPKDGKWPETRIKIGKAAAALAPLGAVAQYAGLSGEAPMKMLGDKIAGDTSVSATHERARQALKAHGQPILVILDDLDRLEAPELLLVLKLVRMIGRLPNVYYLLSYDEQTLIDLLKHTSLVGESDERAQDYLEKLVQVRLDLPALRPYQRDMLVDRAMNSIINQHGLTWSDEQQQRYQRLMHDHLLRRLDSPRTINRVMGQVDAFYGLTEGEVDFVDYLAVTWLRAEEPGVYRMVQQHREDFLGQSEKQMLRAFSQPQPDLSGVAEQWRQRVKEAVGDERNGDDVLDLLTEMFPVVRAEMSRQQLQTQDADDAGVRRGVGHPYYFDHYFSYGTPGEGLADKVVVDALADMVAERSSAAVARLVSELHEETERFIWKLERQLSPDHPAIVPLLIILRSEYARLDDGSNTLTLGKVHQVEGLTYRLLQQLPEEQVHRFVAESLDTTHGLDYMGAVVQTALRKRVRPQEKEFLDWDRRRPFWASHVRGMTVQALSIYFSTLQEMPLDEFDEKHRSRWWTWWHLDPERASEWLRTQVVSGEWDLHGVLLAWVNTQHVVGVANASARLSGLSDVITRDVFSRENLLDYGVGYSADMYVSHGIEDGLEDTDENRDLVVRQAVALRLRPPEVTPGA